MSWWTFSFVFASLLFFSAVFSGSETGVYSLSRVRVEVEARRGRRSARVLSNLLRNDARLLIVLLVGNNLMLELATHLFEAQVIHASPLPAWSDELLVALLLTPIVFLFGELLPKDLLRHRPHTFLGIFAPILGLARYLLLPLAFPLQGLSWGIERLMGLRPNALARALGREELLEIFTEGRREGSFEPEAAELAHNVLGLRATPVEEVMTPWEQAATVDLTLSPQEVRRFVTDGNYSRIPAYNGSGAARRVVGYLHQLDVLRQAARGEADVEVSLRPLASLPPELPVDRALARMRTSGQRMALVGDPAQPRGVVTLMDLVATISGGLVG